MPLQWKLPAAAPVDGFSTMATTAYLGLGGNIGDACAAIRAAVDLLRSERGIRIVAQSRYYRTPPWGETDQDWFVNACIGIETTLPPRELLRVCLAIEKSMGRERTRKWGPRVIDIDILDFGGFVLKDEELILPHPYAHQRAFVLAPLADIAPDLLLDGRRVADWLAETDMTGVEPMDDAG